MGYIYKIYNDINEKVYIGQTTRTVEWRFKDHLKNWEMVNKSTKRPLYKAMLKYGKENFHVEQLEECEDNLLDEREIFYIKKYNSYGNGGYNATRGGDGSRQLSPEDINTIFSMWDSGKSILEIFKKTNISSKWLSKLLREEHNVTSEEIKLRGEQNCNKKDTEALPILCYDLKYKIVGIFSSLTKAANWCFENKIAKGDIKGCRGNIRYTCYGVKKSSYKLHWEFIDFDIITNFCGVQILDLPDKIIPPKCIIQLTLNDEYVNEYYSTAEAQLVFSNKDSTSIQHATNPKDRHKSAYGYKWMYLEDYKKLHPEYVSKFKI